MEHLNLGGLDLRDGMSEEELEQALRRATAAASHGSGGGGQYDGRHSQQQQQQHGNMGSLEPIPFRDHHSFGGAARGAALGGSGSPFVSAADKSAAGCGLSSLSLGSRPASACSAPGGGGHLHAGLGVDMDNEPLRGGTPVSASARGGGGSGGGLASGMLASAGAIWRGGGNGGGGAGSGGGHSCPSSPSFGGASTASASASNSPALQLTPFGFPMTVGGGSGSLGMEMEMEMGAMGMGMEAMGGGGGSGARMSNTTAMATGMSGGMGGGGGGAKSDMGGGEAGNPGAVVLSNGGGSGSGSGGNMIYITGFMERGPHLDSVTALENLQAQSLQAQSSMSGKRWPEKLYQMVNDLSAKAPHVLAWTQEGDSFVINDKPEFETKYLAQYKFSPKFEAFQRQLTNYNFSKDDNEYRHNESNFHRDHPDRLKLVMYRTKTTLSRLKKRPKPGENAVAGDGIAAATGEGGGESGGEGGKNGIAEAGAVAAAVVAVAGDVKALRVKIDRVEKSVGDMRRELRMLVDALTGGGGAGGLT